MQNAILFHIEFKCARDGLSRFYHAQISPRIPRSLIRTLGRNSLIEPKDVRNGCQMSFIREASGSAAFAQVQHGAPIPFPPASVRSNEFCRCLKTNDAFIPSYVQLVIGKDNPLITSNGLLFKKRQEYISIYDIFLMTLMINYWFIEFYFIKCAYFCLLYCYNTRYIKLALSLRFLNFWDFIQQKWNLFLFINFFLQFFVKIHMT